MRKTEPQPPTPFRLLVAGGIRAKFILLGAILCACASPALADDAINQWRSLKYGMFIHFGMATFSATPGNSPRNAANPSTVYAPTSLDVDQWIRVARDAGMKYAVLTAKHTAGHCLWDSKVQFHGKEFDYDVATSGNKTDVVGEFVKACKKYGIAPGLYWCLRDYHNNSKGKKADTLPQDFFQLAQAQITELIRNYPDVGYYWFDSPGFASAQQRKVIYDMIKRLRPGTVVLFNHGLRTPTGPLTIDQFQNSWPSDVFNTERHPLVPGQFVPDQTWEGKTYQLGYEHCDCIGKGWFWSPGESPRSVASLTKRYQEVMAAGGNLLLNVAPDRTGRIPSGSITALMELKQMLAKANDQRNRRASTEPK